MQEYSNCEERRKKIIEFLVIHKNSTCNDLAREFNVSRRTINRDILFLSLTKPITTKRGNRGGISILPDYKICRRYLNDEQEKCLKDLSEIVNPHTKRILVQIIERFSRKK